MQQIEQDSQVMVLTGYPDSQMHFQGFEATVIKIEGKCFKVRDRQGRLFDCKPNELVLMDKAGQH